MSEAFAELLVKFSSSGGAKLDGELKKVETSAGRAGRATDGFMKSLAAFGIVAGSLSIGKEIIDTTREFEKLEAGLITSTGSAENAAKAFDALKEFAAKTPYDLKQTTTAFTQLVNLGLDPSEKAMKSYGNTAAAMNKDLSQMVEAVADAATGEYERLKEFGIKAKSEGDKVTFTFRGMSETVKNNSQSIQDYLIKLGETNFADAMANRMDTLDGALSNLGDSWDQLQNNIGKSGFGDAVEGQVRKATGWMDTLSEKFTSGEVESHLSAIQAAFVDTSNIIESSTRKMDESYKLDKFLEWEKGILHGLANIQKAAATTRVFIAATAYKITSGSTSDFKFPEKKDDESGYDYKKRVAEARAEFEGRPERVIQSLYDAVDAKFSTAFDKIDKSIDGIVEKRGDDAYRKASVLGPRRIEEDRPKSEIPTYDTNYSLASDDIGRRYKEQQWINDRKNILSGKATDRLSEFGVKSTSSSKSNSDTKATDKSKREFESLMESLKTEEEAIDSSYKKRNELILKNTEQGSALRADLEKRSREKYEEDKKKLLESASNDELGKLVDQLKTEEERIEDSYKKRLEIIRSSTKEESGLRKDLEARAKEQHDKEKKALDDRNQYEIDMLKNSVQTESEAMDYKYGSLKEKILESTKLTEQEKADLIKKLDDARRQEEEDKEYEHYKTILGGAEQFFGSLASISETFGGKQSAMYKALFVTQKAFAIASAMLNINKGMADALGDPASVTVEQKIAGMVLVGSAGASILGTLSSINAYDTGGIIPPGRYGLVGEVGPELVKGPAFVTSRRSTADKFKNQAHTVNIHNYAGVEVETKTKQGISGQELEIIIKRVTQQTEAAIASGIARGEGAVTKTLETAYSIRRGRN